MISSLSIQNYALIDQIELQFGPGLNIITGETGAGKSIILGALSLILGKRADTSVLYRKDKKCVVEGVIDIKNYKLESFFLENDLDYEEKLILRREIAIAGKSRAFINDTPVKLSVLHSLSKKLIDLHQQFDTLEIRDNRYQIHLLDLVAENLQTLKNYQSLYKTYKEDQVKLDTLIERQKQSLKEKDYLMYLEEELIEADFAENEQELLEAQLARIKNLDQINTTLAGLIQDLDIHDNSVIPLLRKHILNFENLANIDPKLDKICSNLESILQELVDIHFESEKIQDKYLESPEAATEVEERLELMYRLQHKHQVNSLDDLLNVQTKISDQILSMKSLDEKIDEIKVKIDVQRGEIEKLSDELHNKWRGIIPKIQSFVMKQLKNMGIPHARLEIQLTQIGEFNTLGKDHVEIYFAANEGSDMLSLKKVASGGEISRLNLAMKTLIANEIDLPCLVFDEIDSGISGEIAQRLGNILHNLAKQHQIISITHSPQVAARADRHFKVFKQSDNGKTSTRINILTEEERIVEIAKMLSGEHITDAALTNARELLMN